MSTKLSFIRKVATLDSNGKLLVSQLPDMSYPVSSVAGKTGAVVLSVSDISGAAALASPPFSGIPTAPTASSGTNTTQLATTAFVQSAISTLSASQDADLTAIGNLSGAGFLKRTGTNTWVLDTNTYLVSSDLSSYAPLVDAHLSGIPTAPTPAISDNDTSIATTAFVKSQSYLTTTVASSTYAPLVDAHLSGIPTAPTPTTGDNDTSIATTAFVNSQINSTLSSGGYATQTWVQNNATGLGAGQTWQNVSASRSAGVTYTNTTGKPIAVIASVGGTVGVTGGGYTWTNTVAGITYSHSATALGYICYAEMDISIGTPGYNTNVGTNFCIIPPGETYSISVSFSVTTVSWLELR